MSRYTQPRKAFAALVTALETDEDLLEDVRRSFELLLTRYNTQIYENRFLVGGVTERIIAATFVAMGQLAKTCGVQVKRTDIRIGDVNLSIKGSFRPRPTTIRLVNVMGESKDAIWDEPTIFIISQRGLGYADPELLPGATRRAKDVLELPTKGLFAFWDSNPSYFYPLILPYSRDDQQGSDVASRVVADEIFRYTKRLKPFDKRAPED